LKTSDTINGSPKTNGLNGGTVSTSFPETWTDARIIREMSSAMRTRLFTGKNGPLYDRTPSGVIVEFKHNDGVIYSFFPISRDKNL
jgi:hypothetical protein